MKYFVFRNHTIEPFFDVTDTSFSGYEDISTIEEADRYIWFYLPSYKTDENILSQEINSYFDLLRMTISRINPSKMIILFTMQPIYKIGFQTSSRLIESAISNYNESIYQLASDNKNIKILDISDFYRMIDVSNAIDWRFYYISQMPLNPKLAPSFKQWFSKQLDAIELKRKKCIVLDLDNTLWGGILGEDGIDGIKLGETYPGSAFLDFQKYLLNLSRNGIILTVCSKNNEEDVLEAWEQNPNMILKKEHFVTYRINWNNKADNIKEIAEELNIGLESLVFVDDNPTERELVKQMLPMVEVPDFPKHPYLYLEFAQNLTDNYFRTYALTGEDLNKTQQYKENAERAQFKQSFTDYSDYLKSLDMELTMEKLSDFNIARFAQMTQKTNQFNLTTKRYTETDLKSMANDGYLMYGIRVKDKFGDNGLTGLIIIKPNSNTADIDSLLLSCRILGKGIEIEFVKYIISKLKDTGIQCLSATYIKTLKNVQVVDFYDKLGFTIREGSTEENKIYTLNLKDFEYTRSSIYKIEEQ